MTQKQTVFSLAAMLVVVAACAAWFLPGALPVWLAGWANPAAAKSPVDTDRESDEGEPGLIVLASAELAKQIGIETAKAVAERHTHHLSCNAETAFAGRRSVEVLARVDGIVREVRVELSQVVKRGDVLAVIDSATVGSAKTQYRTAQANLDLAQTTYDRVRKLAEREILAGKSELEAITALTAAKNNLLEAEQRLRNFGFESHDLAKIAAEKSADNLWEVVAPIPIRSTKRFHCRALRHCTRRRFAPPGSKVRPMVPSGAIVPRCRSGWIRC